MFYLPAWLRYTLSIYSMDVDVDKGWFLLFGCSIHELFYVPLDSCSIQRSSGLGGKVQCCWRVNSTLLESNALRSVGLGFVFRLH
jgi:hypothetical protein